MVSRSHQIQYGDVILPYELRHYLAPNHSY